MSDNSHNSSFTEYRNQLSPRSSSEEEDSTETIYGIGDIFVEDDFGVSFAASVLTKVYIVESVAESLSSSSTPRDFTRLTDSVEDLQDTIQTGQSLLQLNFDLSELLRKAVHTNDQLAQLDQEFASLNSVTAPHIDRPTYIHLQTVEKRLNQLSRTLASLVSMNKPVGESTRTDSGFEHTMAQPGPSSAPHTPIAANGQSYHGWGFDAATFVDDDFVDYDRLLMTVRELRLRNFAVKADRDEAIKMIDNLRSGVPIAGHTRRFPPGLYANISVGIVADLLIKLRSAYDFGERYATDVATDKRLGSWDDAKLTTVKILTRLLELHRRTPPDRLYLYGIYNTASFEKTLGLRWL